MAYQSNNNKGLRLPRNKKEWITFIIIVLVTLAVSGFEGLSSLFTNQTTTVNPSDQNTSLVENFDGTNFSIFQPMEHIPVEFVKAVDGDTAVVELNGYQIRLRYLMIDTPEIGDSPQPFALDARDRNRQLLSQAQNITIAFDQGPKTDNYDRALVYVYADGVSILETLLQEGLASVRYVNPPNNSLEDQFRNIQRQAQDQSLGIWSN